MMKYYLTLVYRKLIICLAWRHHMTVASCIKNMSRFRIQENREKLILILKCVVTTQP